MGAALAFALSACGPQSRKPGIDELRTDPAVAAIVEGDPIYVDDVQLEAEAQNLVKHGDELGIESPIFGRVLEELIDQKLLAREADRRKLGDTPEARFQLQAARERILGNLVVQNLVDAKVTEEAVRRLYREQVNDMKLGEEVRCRHILVATETEAQAVKTSLDKGADFATLAFQKSLDPATRLDGGDLGYVSLDSLAPPFAAAAQRTPVGKISTPFKTDAGWHVLSVEDKRAQGPPTLEQMRPELVKFLLFDQIQDVLKGLRSKAKVERKTAEPTERIIEALPQPEPPASNEPEPDIAAAPQPAPSISPAAPAARKIEAPRLTGAAAGGPPPETDEAAPFTAASKALPPASGGGAPAPPKPAAKPALKLKPAAESATPAPADPAAPVASGAAPPTQ